MKRAALTGGSARKYFLFLIRRTETTNHPNPPSLTLAETAGRLGRHPDTVKAWVRAGILVPVEGGGRGRAMMFAAADVDAAVAPQMGAPARGSDGEDAWRQAGVTCAAEIQSLSALARRQFRGRLSRELDLVAGEPTAGTSRSVAAAISRLRTAPPDVRDGLAFNLQLVKAHVMRDILGISHAKTAQALQVSTTSLYRLLAAWKQMVVTGVLPVQESGEDPDPVSPVPVETSALERIVQLPVKQQASAFIRAAREVDPVAVRRTGRRSRTLSSKEISYMRHKESTVAPSVMADPGESAEASPIERAIGRAYSDDGGYEAPDEYDSDDDDDSDLDERYDDYEAEEALALVLDAADAGLDEYEALREGRPWPTAEADSCHCTARVELRGLEADWYVKDHLQFSGRDERQVGLYLCPNTGRRWYQDWPNAGPSSWGDTRLRQLR